MQVIDASYKLIHNESHFSTPMTSRPERVHPNLSEGELAAIDQIRAELGVTSRADVVRMALHAFFKARGLHVEVAMPRRGRKAGIDA